MMWGYGLLMLLGMTIWWFTGGFFDALPSRALYEATTSVPGGQ